MSSFNFSFGFFLIVLGCFIGAAIDTIWFCEECEDCSKYIKRMEDIETAKILDGTWLPDMNYTRAMDIAKKKDSKGDWVCVNVRDMTYSRAVEVCQHEVGHEIFAEECEKNFTKCLEIMDDS